MVSVCVNGLNLELYGKFSLNLCFIDNGIVQRIVCGDVNTGKFIIVS
jgi:hypothetical protein